MNEAKIAAHLSLVTEHARIRAEHSAHVCDRGFVSQDLLAKERASYLAVEASARALAAPQAEPGFVLVPVEPDETMESAGDMVLSCGAADVYKAMLAARPATQPTPAGEVAEPQRCKDCGLSPCQCDANYGWLPG